MAAKNAFPEDDSIMNPATMRDMAVATQKAERHLARIDSEYGDGLPWDPGRVAAEIHQLIANTAYSLIRTARLIAWAHERMSKVEWITWLGKEVRIGESTGYRYLSVAQKFEPEDMKVIKRLPAPAVFEYFACSEDDLARFRKEIEADGTVAGHTLDKEDRKSIRELCHDLRKTRERNRLLEKNNDDLRVRLKTHEREFAELEAEIGEPLVRLESMICATIQRAIELLRAEPDVERRKSARFVICWGYYRAFKGIEQLADVGEPILPPAIKEELDNVYERQIAYVRKLRKSQGQ